MKKILWILCLLLVLIISSCENGTFGEEPLEIPEGAVNLTKFNFATEAIFEKVSKDNNK